jgi:adenosine 3'-phospho 5'-phosphosulfate transporter B3
MDGDVRKPSGTAPLETPPEHTPRPRIAGVELPFGSATSFGLLAGGHLLCAIGFSALQEKVFRIPGFVYSEYITLVQMLSYSACAFAEMAAVERRILPRAPLSKYALLSAFTFGGNSLTNHALMYLDYATRIVFKSARVIPVMLFERLIQGKRHSTFAYASAGMLVVGIALFTLGDAAALPSFNPMGVLLIVLALSLDAITCNFEEGSLFTGKHHNGTLYGHERCSQAEVIAFSMPMSAVWSLCSCIGGGELQPAIGHSIVHLTTTPLIVLSSVLGYLSIAFVLSLIKHFGASETEIVKSLRKVLSIVTSFVLYSKPINWKYCAGFAMMLISIYFTVEQRRRKEAGKTSPAPTSLGTKGNADGLASDANCRK